MKSKDLCQKLGITAKQLALLVKRGLPRCRGAIGKRASWGYDENAVAEWVARQTANSAVPPAAPPTEPIARTVPEALLRLRECGVGVSERVFRSWMTQAGFPGRPGMPGRQDGYFPILQIAAWSGDLRQGLGEPRLLSEMAGPRARLLETRARREELELAKEEGRLVERSRSEATIARIIAVVVAQLEGLADELASQHTGEMEVTLKRDLGLRIDKLREVCGDLLAQDAEDDPTTGGRN